MVLGMVSRGGAIAAGLCGAVFLAYCFYFDRKRRNAPDFKSKLRQRRKRMQQNQELSNVPKLPDMKDPEAVQKFFLEEVQLGEELLTQDPRRLSTSRAKEVTPFRKRCTRLWVARALPLCVRVSCPCACLHVCP
uniref:Mitochondrial import receptor subunit TOM20 homolog isoform X4 n=1 Tax=Petromyzon marinus TaxID=7757 RepID=A0AAJ7TI43_PETMA|nr:mitochondrial import receptor subunit TOM20 homolog isoform X4 [Petromyzon marinus]